MKIIEFNEWLTQDAGAAAAKGGLGAEAERNQVQLVRTDRLPETPTALADLAARALLLPAPAAPGQGRAQAQAQDGLCTLCARSVRRAELEYESYTANLMRTLME